MYCHCGRRHNKGFFSRYCKWHTDWMSTAKH
jgi:hypothetical protein